MEKKYIVRLTDEEREACREVIKKLKGTSEKVRRAQILLKADADGPAWTDRKVAEAFPTPHDAMDSVAFVVDDGHKRLGNGHENEVDRQTTSPQSLLAMTGVHPKIVQTVMRHQSITLTMDTYGHLFPGQEVDAVSRMREMMVDLPQAALRATGTDNATADASSGAQRQAQHAGRETGRDGATAGDERTKPAAQKQSPKPLQIADLGDDVRRETKGSGGGTRTPDTRIMIPLL